MQRIPRSLRLRNIDVVEYDTSVDSKKHHSINMVIFLISVPNATDYDDDDDFNYHAKQASEAQSSPTP